MNKFGFILFSVLAVVCFAENSPLTIPERVASGEVTEYDGEWNDAVEDISYESAADNSRQAMLFYKPDTDEPRPLLVALHSWSADYQQRESVIYAEWCIANDWIFIHPNFRGPNDKPETTGSEFVIQDVLSAIDYAKENANVDAKRIYALGWSGGGYLGLLLAGRAPDVWAGISSWVPISDLNAWYQQSRRLRTKYVSEIRASCGGTPVGKSAAAEECRKRSPLTYLEKARGVPIHIYHGIRDGHAGDAPVPVSQSLHAFNMLAQPEDRFTAEEIEYFTRRARVPRHLKKDMKAAQSFGDLKVFYHRQSGRAQITIFDGRHHKNTEAGIRWLNEQAK